MEAPYDSSAPKKPTNVSVNADLLRQARELRINLSRALEERLVELVSAKRREEWLEENRDAIEEFNRRVDRRGVFSTGLRRF
jgi:antitoxin CcdA